jgi:tetratricopeptide (TPR) repeat protein
MLVLAILVSPVYKPQPSRAGDFGAAQQTFVPASLIPRRVDLDSEGQTTTYSQTNQNGFPTDPNAVNNLLNGLNTGTSNDNSNSTVVTTGKGSSALQNLMNLGRFDDAETTAKSALQRNPKDPTLRANLADVLVSKAKHLLNKNDLNNAGAKAREALVYEPSNHNAKAVINQIFAKQGLNGQNPKDHLKVADSLAAQRHLMEASVEYKLALELKPAGAPHIGLGNLDVATGRFTEAKKEYQVAVELDPKSSVAYRQMGSLSYSLHDLTSANTELGKALSINSKDQLAANLLIELWQHQIANAPTSANAYLGLARTYLQIGDLDAARAAYQQVARLEPNNPSLPQARAAYKACLARREAAKCYEAAKTLDSIGADNEAHDKLTESLNYDPTSIGCLLLNGKVCEKLGYYTDAHDSYMSVLKEDPRNLIAAQRLKGLYAKTGGTKLAAAGLSATAQSLPAVGRPATGGSLAAVGLPASTQSVPASTGLLTAETPRADLSEVVPPAQPFGTPAAPPQLAPAHPAAPVVPVADSAQPVTPVITPVSTEPAPATPDSTTSTPTLQPSPATTIETPASSSAIPAGELQPEPVSELPTPTSQLPLPPANAEAQSASHVGALGSFLTTLRNASTQQTQTNSQAESQTSSALQAAGLLPSSQSSYGSYGSLGGSSSGLPLLSSSQMSALTTIPSSTGIGSPLYLTSPSSTAIQLPNNTTTTSVANSPSATKSLMQFLASPVAQKMGFQPIDSSANTAPTTGVMTTERIVQGSNGQYYMVPTAVPVVINQNQQNQPTNNPAINNFINSKFGQRFHLGGAAQALSSMPNPMSLLPSSNSSSTRNTSAVKSVTASLNEAPNQAATTDPLVQVKDWSTTSEPEPASADVTSAEPKMSAETPAVAMMPGGAAPTIPVAASDSSAAPVVLKPPVAITPTATSNRQVTLELADVKPTSSGIKVKVLLRNQGRTEVKIPANQKIAVRSAGQSDQLLDVKFDSHAVPAGGTVAGNIKIPGHDIDPKADVFLPNFLGDGTQLSDLHLTTATDSSM